MRALKEVELLATGLHLPGDPVPFEQIENVIGHLDAAPLKIQKLVQRLKPSIKKLLGIEQCYFAVDPVTGEMTETVASMSTKAISSALNKAGLAANDLDCIILAGPLSDHQTPPTTTYIQEQLKIDHCAEMEIHSNCTGMTKALQVAYDAIRIGRYRTVAVSYSQLSSAYLRASVYNQAKVKAENLLLRWFLSDSASALILTARDQVTSGIKVSSVYNESLGGKLEPAMWSHLGARNIVLPEVYEAGLHHLGQDYDTVNKLGPHIVKEGVARLIKQSGVAKEEIDHVLATIPSIVLFEKTRDLTAQELDMPNAKWFCNMQKSGYSGGSSVIIGLNEMIAQAVFKPGETLACVTVESSKWMVGGFTLKYEVE